MRVVYSLTILANYGVLSEQLFSVNPPSGKEPKCKDKNKEINPFSEKSMGLENQSFEWEGVLHQAIPMTDMLRQKFLDMHNEFRNKAAGGTLTNDPRDKAKKLPALQWDMDLERNSLEWSKKCHWGHSSWKNWNNLAYDYGENLAASTMGGENENYGQGAGYHKAANETSVWPWVVSEFPNYNHRTHECDDNKVCGHYTQVVDQGTTRVGCAVVECNEISGTNWSSYPAPHVYVTCQYLFGQIYDGEKAGMYDYVDDASEAAGSECDEMDEEWGNLCKNLDHICNTPSYNDRCQKGGICFESDWFNGVASDFTCDCANGRDGRWCEKDNCPERDLPGQQIATSQIIKVSENSNAYQLCSKESFARSDCDDLVECIGVATIQRDDGSVWWVKIKGVAEYGPADYEGAIIYYRDCTDLDTPEPTEDAPVTDAPTNAPTDAPTDEPSVCDCPEIVTQTCPEIPTTTLPVTTTTEAPTTTTTTTPEPTTIDHSANVFADSNGIVWLNDEKSSCLKLVPKNKKTCDIFKIVSTDSCDDLTDTTIKWIEIPDENNSGVFRLATQYNDIDTCKDQNYAFTGVQGGNGKFKRSKAVIRPYSEEAMSTGMGLTIDTDTGSAKLVESDPKWDYVMGLNKKGTKFTFEK